MSISKKRLSDLLPNDVAQVAGFVDSCPVVYRRALMARGILPCSEIKVIRRAPLGDPIEFCVRDYRLTLRQEEAKYIQVKPA